MRTVAALLLLAASLPAAETLSPATLREFELYMRLAESHMNSQPKLWVEQGPGRREDTLKGSVTTSYYLGNEPRKITSGLIHDWVGTVFIPQAKLSDALKVLRDYNRHAEIYAPDVISSKLVSSSGDTDHTSLRLMKKKVIVVVYDVDFSSRLQITSPSRAQIAIRSDRVAEVDDPGERKESIRQPDNGSGFLWRINSWYVLEERPDGLWLQLRSISLTRDIPLGLNAVIGPMVNNLPRETLVSTLDKTRKVIQALR